MPSPTTTADTSTSSQKKSLVLRRWVTARVLACSSSSIAVASPGRGPATVIGWPFIDSGCSRPSAASAVGATSISCTNGARPVLAELSQEQTPFILAYHEPQRPYAAVAVDNRQGMAMATEHLLGLGHSRIALVSGPAQQSDRSERRFAGYCQAMATAGLPTLPRLELASHTDADWAELAPLLEGVDLGYVCGSARFASYAEELLVAGGLDPAAIRVERFGPTGD